MDQLPPMRDPWLIAAFEGPSDAGAAGSDLVEHLAEAWHAEPVHVLDADRYLDYRESPPRLIGDDDGGATLHWPRLQVRWARPPGSERDVLLLSGPEPGLQWRRLCAEVLDLAVRAGATTLLAVAGTHDEVPHTHPVAITGWSPSPTLRRRIGRRIEAPLDGLATVLVHQAAERGLAAATVSAAVPAYVGHPPQPKAVLALMNAVEDLLLDVSLPAGDWEEQAQAWQVGADQFVEEDPDLVEYVEELEQIQSAEDLHEASGDAIAREFERFMRRREGDGDR